MKNPQRIALVTSLLCGTAVLSGWVIAGLAGVGSARIENAAGALPVEVRHSPSVIAEQRADKPQAMSKRFSAPLSSTPMQPRSPNR